MPYSVLLVCETNICLSPLATAILGSLIEEHSLSDTIEVESAGAFAGNTPRPAERRTIEVAEKHGLSLGQHASSQVVPEHFKDRDLVIAFSDDAFWHLKSIAPENSKAQLAYLADYSGDLGLRRVPDPVLGEKGFEETFELLETLSKGVFSAIQKTLSGNF